MGHLVPCRLWIDRTQENGGLGTREEGKGGNHKAEKGEGTGEWEQTQTALGSHYRQLACEEYGRIDAAPLSPSEQEVP